MTGRGGARPARRSAKAAVRSAGSSSRDAAGPVVLLGAGATATAVGSALRAAGLGLELWARSRERLRRLERRLAGHASPQPALSERSPASGLRRLGGLHEIGPARRVLLCVPDAALEDLAAELAAAVPAGRGRIALHTSGARGGEALASLARHGWATGSLHPLLSFPPPATRRVGEPTPPADAFAGALVAIDGSPPARLAARDLARTLGARPVILAGRSRPRYHAAAALLAGGLAALHAAAEDLLVGLLPARTAREGLAALAASVLANARRAGGRAALSGPAARGELELVLRHIEAIEGVDRDAARLYRLLAARMLLMAAERGTLGEERARRLSRQLSRTAD